MADSNMVTYEYYGHKHWSNRQGNKVDKIVIHHAAGIHSMSAFQNAFNSRNSSATYVITNDGQVGQFVSEQYRPWTTGSWEIDKRAITIEVSNSSNSDSNWPVSDAVLAVLIKLVADICKRNGITDCSYTGNKSGVLQMHKWYAATACPGPYLASKFPYISQEVNKLLKGGGSVITLQNGYQKVTYKNVLMHVYKGNGDSKQLYALSAKGDYASRQTIDKFDHSGMYIYAAVNGGYFDMQTGQHYGVEQTDGDGVNSSALDLAPKNGSYMVAYQLKDGTIGRCVADKYYYSKDDVLWAITPYSIVVDEGKACNYRTSAYGNKDNTANTQTMAMYVDDVWVLVTTASKVLPSLMQSFALECNATFAMLMDSGGSTQMYAWVNKEWTSIINTQRSIANVLVLGCFKDEQPQTSPETTPEPEEETVPKAEYDALKDKYDLLNDEYAEATQLADSYKNKLTKIKEIVEE